MANFMNHDEWNLNQIYLGLIMSFIIEYNQAKFSNDYQMMFKALDCLESTTSPKIDNDEVEANLKIIEKNIQTMEQRDENNKIICYYPDLIFKTTKLMNETYKFLLIKLEDKGMLTRKQKDPAHAMGRFSSG